MESVVLVFQQFSIIERLFHFVPFQDFFRLAFLNSNLFQLSHKIYKNLTPRQQNYILLSVRDKQINYSIRLYHEEYCDVQLGIYFVPVLLGTKWVLHLRSLDLRFSKFVHINSDFDLPDQTKRSKPIICHIPSFFTKSKKDIKLIRFDFASKTLFVLVSDVNQIDFFICSTCLPRCEQNSFDFVRLHIKIFPFLDLSTSLNHPFLIIGPKFNLLIKHSSSSALFIQHDNFIHHFLGNEHLKIHRIRIQLHLEFREVIQDKYFIAYDNKSFLVYNWENASWYASEITTDYRNNVHMIYLGQSVICVAHDFKWNFIVFFNCKTMKKDVVYSRELVNIFDQKHKIFYNTKTDRSFFIQLNFNQSDVDILTLIDEKLKS
jgi:hypothetical protein